MNNFDEALHNIDVFCKVLAKKIIEGEKNENENSIVEPMEKLLYRKYVVEQESASSSVRTLIPLPQLEEPLIDVFEDDDYVRIFMQCRCKDEVITVRGHVDGIEICKRECHTDINGVEVCVENCRKVELTVSQLKTDDIITKCVNNEVFEVNIPKVKSAR
ncbi:MAG: hypothetical protein QXJ02_01270 [Candidatus Bathyarchaeia archaeon]